ncbi:MAG TPA: RICIN domain-containing protein, partial [Micromonosporaceae bacterium]|nr:RICIN domain-containing protein [Micromonosporaceae bacterium]HLL67348.1 RICIN domain-containing protein [Micromonosporaceae bacterium]
STADGAQVVQWTCTTATNQTFRLQPTTTGIYQLIAAHSGKCVDVTAASLADAATLVQWTCTTGTNQRWRITGGPA